MKNLTNPPLSETATGIANSFDEWTPLKEVIVGRAEHFLTQQVDSSFRLFYFDNVRPPNGMQEVKIPSRLLGELHEDLSELVSALRNVGVKVLRPAELKRASTINSPFWSAIETPALNVRDQAIIIGNSIIETAPHQRSRYFENDYLKPIFYPYFNAGSPWISMPKPALARDSLDPSFFNDVELNIDFEDAGHLGGLGFEMIFDGAQCIRFGRDIIVNVANKNHALGFEWLKRCIGDEFRFWELPSVADSHIDSLIVPLRPGLLLLRNPDIVEYLPEPLQKWDKLYPPVLSEDNFPDYSSFGFNLASRYIDTNVLSVDENTVIANSLCPELCKALELRGFDVIRVQHRHRRLFNGGFHCFTLDTVRAGGLETYF